jgi:hypothetical protein
MSPHERDGYAVYGFWLQVLTVVLLMLGWLTR